MLLFDRRKFVLLLAALPVAACGFQPVYQQGGAARELNGNLSFNLIDTREGFLLLEQLEKRFGQRLPSARYNVNVDLVIYEEKLMLTAATGLFRITLSGFAKLSVIDQATGEEVFADKLRDVIGFSGDEETLATLTSRADALDKLIISLADKIVLRLTSTAQSWAE